MRVPKDVIPFGSLPKRKTNLQVDSPVLVNGTFGVTNQRPYKKKLLRNIKKKWRYKRSNTNKKKIHLERKTRPIWRMIVPEV